MTIGVRAGVTMAVVALLSACGGSADEGANTSAAAAATEAPAAADPLVGAWASDAPADFSGEGLRTRMSDGRTRYGADGGFGYQARLTIFGAELPSEGMSFAIDATGRWQRQGERLTEDYTQVRVVPEHEDGELRRLANQLGEEMVAEPATVSTIDMLEGNRLTLTTEGRAQNYTRR